MRKSDDIQEAHLIRHITGTTAGKLVPVLKDNLNELVTKNFIAIAGLGCH